MKKIKIKKIYNSRFNSYPQNDARLSGSGVEPSCPPADLPPPSYDAAELEDEPRSPQRPPEASYSSGNRTDQGGSPGWFNHISIYNFWLGGSSSPNRSDSGRERDNEKMGVINAALTLMAIILAAIMALPYVFTKTVKSIRNLLNLKKPLKSLWRLSTTLFGGAIGWLNGVALGTAIGLSLVPGPHTPVVIAAVCYVACSLGSALIGAAIGAFFGKYSGQLAALMMAPSDPDPDAVDAVDVALKASRTNPAKYTVDPDVKKKFEEKLQKNGIYGISTADMVTQLKTQKNDCDGFFEWISLNRPKKRLGNKTAERLRNKKTEVEIIDHGNGNRYALFTLPHEKVKETLAWAIDEKRWYEVSLNP